MAFSCTECGGKRGHLPGCPAVAGNGHGRGGGNDQRTRDRRRGEVLIAAHRANWSRTGRVRSAAGVVTESYRCTVCSRVATTQSSNGRAPAPEQHPETRK